MVTDFSKTSQTETNLAEVWEEVLKKKSIDRNDDFFELGGDSITAVQVIARLREVFQINLAIQDFFDASKLAVMAEKIDALIQQLSISPPPTINHVICNQGKPLTFSQEQMWFIQQLSPSSSAYNIAYSVEIDGELDFSTLKSSFNRLADRHETLRTTFPAIDGQPRCRISLSNDLACEKIDLRFIPEDIRKEKVKQLMIDEAAKPFDLENGPLTHFVLFIVSEKTSFLLLSLHHMIFDAWSLTVLIHDLMAFYQAEINGIQPDLPPIQIQYTDYAFWQRQWFQGEVRNINLDYWRSRLEGISPLNLPTDRPRPIVQTYNGTIRSYDLDDELFHKLQELAISEVVTTFIVCLAAFQLLMSRYSSQTDIAIGIPVSNRDWLETESLICSLVNTLVIRMDLSRNPTFRELLQQARQIVLKAYTYQNMPFGDLVAALNPTRDPSYSPLVQVVFNMINVPKPEIILDHLKINPNIVEVDRRASQFDLSFTIYDVPGFRKINVEYSIDLFEQETIERMMGQYKYLLRSIISNPDQAIDTIPLLSQKEREILLEKWNATQMALPENCELVSIIRSQASKTPDAIAIIGNDASFNYTELVHRIDRLASELQSHGILPGDRVGLGLQRTSDLVIAPLAIMALGAIYVPLDPGFPDNRLKWIIEDSNLTLIVTHNDTSQRWPKTIRQICLDRPDFWDKDSYDLKIAPRLDSSRLAYILYTSGSTGRPKGVAVPQNALVNFLCSMVITPGIVPSDVLLAVTTIAFDIAGLELFLPLMTGATVVVASQVETRDAYQLKELLTRYNVTILQATPVTWRMLLAAGWQGKGNLRAFCGGEVLLPDLAIALLPKVEELWNLYGPTETTIWSTIIRVNEDHLHKGMIPIGRPIGNTQVYVLDSHMEPVPQGVVGELFIGGAGLAAGYYAHPELTDQRFVKNPFCGVSGAQIYRTGDDVRWDNDGQLHYIGRRDGQIKIRGFRIELGEIETVIDSNPEVKQCVVVAQGERPENVRLVAYYERASTDSKKNLLAELNAVLKTHLPEYMIPSVLIELDHLPLTPNEKVDRKALHVHKWDENAALAGYVAPRTPLEIGLAEIWTGLLEVKKVGLHDDFFALGGQSLLSVRLMAEIQKRFGLKLPLSILFQSPNIEALARTIENRQNFPDHPPFVSPLVPIKTNCCRIPIFLVHPIGGGVFGYTSLARYIDENQPVYGLEARPEDANRSYVLSIETIAAYYLEAVQQYQPHGPYHLGGYSFGGTIAFEMAQQLHAQGQEVGLLAMLDNDAPKSGYDQPRLNRMFITGFFKNLPYWWNDFWHISARQRIGRIRRKLFSRLNQTGYTNLDYYVDDVSIVPQEYRELMEKHFQAYDLYQPKPYDGKVTLFRTPRQPLFCSFDPHLEWDHLAKGGVEVYPVAGAHRNLLEEPYVKVLAEALQQALDSLSP